MINNTTTINTSPHHINVFGISFGVGIGILSLISIILLTSCLCFNKAAPRSGASSVSSTDDQDSITIETGLNEAILNTYPVFPYSKAMIEKQYPEEAIPSSSCSICLQEYKDSDMVRLLPDCDHLFHLQCIDPWLKLHRKCPVCRNSLVQSPPAMVQL